MKIRRTPQRIRKSTRLYGLLDAAVESVQVLTQLSVRDETAWAVYAGDHVPRHATA